MNEKLSQQGLAEQLGVSQPAVSQATALGHRCAGVDVASMAQYGADGRLSHYEVPEDLMPTVRKNPSGKQPEHGESAWTVLLIGTAALLATQVLINLFSDAPARRSNANPYR